MSNMTRVPGQVILILMCCILSVQVAFGVDREQVISLKKGWNAVYLEVNPVVEQQNLSSYLMPPAADQSATASTPIQIIATYYPNFSSVEFISDPNEADWKKPSWNKWIRDDLPDSFLSNLYDLEAGRGYLVKSEADYDWVISGEVEQLNTRWQPGTFNLVGFQVQENGPSFHQLFSGNTTAVPLQKGPIFQLVQGQWKEVSLPDTQVNKGEAYWVFNDGMAEFQGGASVQIQGNKTSIDFSDIADFQSLTITNTTARAITIDLNLVDNNIPLSLKVSQSSDDPNQDSYQISYEPVTDLVSSLEIDANDYEEIILAVRRSEITESKEYVGLLKLTINETYEELFFPISAYGVDTE